MAINIQNICRTKQVNSLLGMFYFSIILWSFRYFGGLSGNSGLSGKSRDPMYSAFETNISNALNAATNGHGYCLTFVCRC